MASEHDDKEHSGGHGGGHGGGGHGGGGHGPGGGGHEEHEGAPEWLISFADNVALMMGFFVILLAMNMKEPTTGGIGGKEKFPSDQRPEWLDAVIELRKAFGNEVRIDSANPAEQVLVRRLRERQRDHPGDISTPGPEGDKRQTQSPRPGDLETPCAVVAFDEGSADLSASERQKLADAARQIAGQHFVIDVRGYVSAQEAFDSGPDRGMRLSFERAHAAARILEENGLNWRQLRVIAGGDTRRITARATDQAGHRSNQRTELYQTNDVMPDDPYAQATEGNRSSP